MATQLETVTFGPAMAASADLPRAGPLATLDETELVFILPALVSAVFAAVCFLRRRPACLRRGFVLGFTLPLAVAYVVFLAWPRRTLMPFWDEFFWHAGGVLLFTPQVIVLFAMGMVYWTRTVRGIEGPRPMSIRATLLTVLIGHAWTKIAMSGL
ncbi:MAG TPA: hypothetical protein VF601_11220 [Beijerinckiaceae bacterium]|jgi:hypothetical protein